MSLLSSLDSFSNLRLLRSRRVNLDQTWTVSSLFSAFWRLWYFDEPSALLRGGRKEFLLAPDCLHIIPAWILHDRQLLAPCSCAYVHFDLVGVSRRQVTRIAPDIISLPCQGALESMLRRWRVAVDQGTGESPEGCCFAKALTLCALGESLESLPEASRQQLREPQNASPVIQRIQELIWRDLNANLTNERLAREHHMSPETLIKKFKKELGATPAQYVLEQRLNKAAELLAFTAESMETIAESAGFSDRYHLSKVFRAKMGIPPARYRGMNRQP